MDRPDRTCPSPAQPGGQVDHDAGQRQLEQEAHRQHDPFARRAVSEQRIGQKEAQKEGADRQHRIHPVCGEADEISRYGDIKKCPAQLWQRQQNDGEEGERGEGEVLNFSGARDGDSDGRRVHRAEEVRLAPLIIQARLRSVPLQIRLGLRFLGTRLAREAGKRRVGVFEHAWDALPLHGAFRFDRVLVDCSF